MPESKEETADNGIQVYLRIRPSSNPVTYFQRDDIDLNRILVKVPKKEDTINNSRSGYSFAFTSILDDKASQRDVFRNVGVPAIKNALAGFNSTIFAYGQTGSGKTFTITGGPDRYDDRGIIPRAIAHLFKAMKTEGQKGTSCSCYISYLEIYNQSGYDLLMENNHNSNADEVPKVTMLEDEDGNFHFKNLSMHMVSSEEDALNLLFLGDTNRAIAATEMNQNSTRSHCIFTIILEKRSAGADTVTRSKLNIVDLAGSERVGRTTSAGQTLREAKYINSSLFFLEMVIVALHEKEKKRKDVHVPYRNSMMTSVLRDSLGGNCKTSMIATISPESQHTGESISTCHFAQRVSLVKNSASVNEEVEPELVIQRLRAEVRRLREEVEFLSGKNNDDDDSSCEGDEHLKLPQHQSNELSESIQKYIQDRDQSSHLDFCGGITLPKIRAVCSIFKEMFLNKTKASLSIDDDRGGSDVESSDEEMLSNQNDASDSGSGTVRVKQKQKSAKTKVHQHDKKHSIIQKTGDGSFSETNTVCGVPICRDRRVLDEPSLAFSWFKDRYPGRDEMDKNKNLLKMKYSEAKNAGNRIDGIRSRMSQHKDAIEKLRKNCAIRMFSGHGEKMGEDRTSSDENFLTNAINQEKTVYKETLESLRELKSVIERTQKMVEKGRLKLQADFDTWYHEVCHEESQTHIQRPSNEGKSNLVEPNSKPCKNTRNEDRTQSIVEPSSLVVGGRRRGAKQPVAESQNDFKLPPGIQLTGNAEADADIIAFFKAKEVLLSKSSLSR